jgi:multidrug efflux pump subunit AcrA (membrane-fusion protein)
LALSVVTIPDRAGGPFQFRPASRTEVRAPVAGFVREFHADEGSAVQAGDVLVVLEVPGLTSRVDQKQAEVREARARLKLLEAGPRADEVDEQRRRVDRAAVGRDLAGRHLASAREAMREELTRLDEQIAQHKAELAFAEGLVDRFKRLGTAASRDEFASAERQRCVAQAMVEQVRAQKRAREAAGVQETEAEFARRERELADERAKLALLTAGSRPEEVEAERARLARLAEELRHLRELTEATRVVCRSAGVVVTPRLTEKIDQYVREGDLIAVVEDSSGLEAEVAVPEDESARVRVGQRVGLKVRAHLSGTFAAEVVRVAPVSTPGTPDRPGESGRVTVYCRPTGSTEGLRPGMTGYARIYSDERSVGAYLLDQGVRFVRTEFWW